MHIKGIATILPTQVGQQFYQNADAAARSTLLIASGQQLTDTF